MPGEYFKGKYIIPQVYYLIYLSIIYLPCMFLKPILMYILCPPQYKLHLLVYI